MDATLPSIDPVQLVNQLDAEQIRQRLDALNREREALQVLLRAALRIERPPSTLTRMEEVRRAD
jgi:hypothetical protein